MCIIFLICSKDGNLSCGYSSFRGKRATMEDFYDVKSSKIDGQTINLFGIFDGLIFFLLILISFILHMLFSYLSFLLMTWQCRSWRFTCCWISEAAFIWEPHEAPTVYDRHQTCYKYSQLYKYLLKLATIFSDVIIILASWVSYMTVF